MASLRPAPTFVRPATPFLASSTETTESGRAAAAIFGAPLDLSESFRSGARHGPGAVRSMSESLETYTPVLDRDLEDLRLRDLGDLDLNSMSIEVAIDAISDAAAHAVRTGQVAVMLGGEHTGSLGGFRGIKRVYADAVIIQADAHLDLRPEYDGESLTHATWLHHVGEEFGFDLVHQVGLRSGDRAEWRLARGRTAWSSPDLSLPPLVRQRIGARPVYVSIDIDVLDPAHAPGTGCPEPGGVTFRELAAFVYSLSGLNVVGVDVMEVSPEVDPSNITAAAAAKLVREAVLLFGASDAG
ncbi:MAG TPA: agmatinase [Chloroflexota bacterium]